MLAQGFLKVKGQAQITKCYFLWFDVINMQSLSGHYLMRQQAPMMFSLHLGLPQYCCLHFWRSKVGSMLEQGFLRVKSQAKITKCYFLWVGAINMQSLNGHYLMRKQVPVVFLLLLVYLGAVAYISVEISLGSCWRRDILRVKGQELFTNCNFLWSDCDMQSSRRNYSIRHQVPMVSLFLLVYLSAVAYISIEISLGSCRRRDILRVNGQGLITNCNFLWLCVICNHLVVTTRCVINYPWWFYLF